MSEEFKNAFNKLSEFEKKKKINEELIIVRDLMKKIESRYNIQGMSNIEKYDLYQKGDISESEVTLDIYDNIYNIEKELITLLSIISME